MTQSAARIPQLDGWRGISVALVIFAHVVNFRLGYDIRPAKFIGAWGVDIFFVISGFIITKLALREWQKTQRFSLRDFYFRRLFRIVPPLFAYLACISLLAHYGLIEHRQTDSLLSAAFACNVADCDWFVAHTWSLAYEEQFYLVFPLVFGFFLPAFRRTAGVLLVALMALPFVGFVSRIGSLHTVAEVIPSFSFICLGVVIAANEKTFSKLAGSQLYVPITVVAVSALCALAISSAFDLGHATLASYVQKVGLTVLLPLSIGWLVCSSAVRDNEIARALGSAPLAYVGRLSYSLYLWQMLFTGPALLYARSPWSPAFMLIAAAASYYAIERPMIGLGRSAISAMTLRRRESEAAAPPAYCLDPEPSTPCELGSPLKARRSQARRD